MKKNNVLLCCILSILSLTLGACSSLLPQNFRSRRNSSELVEDSSQINEQRSEINRSTAHSHQWSAWYTVKQSTCTEPGLQQRVCNICGQSQDRQISPRNHDYHIVDEYIPYCGSGDEGYRLYRCTFCGDTYKETFAYPSSNHNWDNGVYISPQNSTQVGYLLKRCACGQASRLEITAIEGTLLDNSSIKGGTPEGFMKLNTNGMSISYSFYYEGYGSGTLYQRAAMDAFSSNTQRTYASTSTSSSVGDQTEGNFRVTVNGVVIDKSPYMNLTYEQMLSNGEYDERLQNSGNYSPLADCPIGQVFIQKGYNTITFTRLGSYNLTIEKFVIEINNYSSDAHNHILSNSWSYDENYHWHTCVDQNCPTPGAMIDYSGHSFEDEYLSETTCVAGALIKRTCTVCGYSYQEEQQKSNHNWQSVGSIAVDEGYVGSEEYRCSSCGIYAYRWNALLYDEELSNGVERNTDYIRFNGTSENSGGNESRGSHIVYKVNLPRAVTSAGLSFKVMVHSSTSYIFDTYNGGPASGYVKNQDGSFSQINKRYGLKVNDVEYFMNKDGIEGQRSSIDWFDWPVSFPLKQGENIIDVFQYDTYRLRMYEFQLTGVSYITPNHTHVAGETYYYDGEHHWQECTSGDGYRFPSENHVFSSSPIEVKGPTCTESGYYMYECTVCHATRQDNIQSFGHSWDEGVVTREPSHAVDGLRTYTCSTCHETKAVAISASGHTTTKEPSEVINSEGKTVYKNVCDECGKVWYSMPIDQNCMVSGTIGDTGKMDRNSVCKWRIPVHQSGTVSIQLPLAMSTSGQESQTFMGSYYVIKVNGVEQPSLLPENCKYGDFLTLEDKYFSFAEYTVTAQDVENGEIEIEFDHNNQSYRLVFRNNIKVCYL